jgi:hypothetical protein
VKRFVTWLVANPVGALTVGGLAVYGVVRLSYALFYEPLGVTPEEVGLGYQQTLAESALAVVVILLILGGAVATVLIFYATFLGLLLRFRWRVRPKSLRATTPVSIEDAIRILDEKLKKAPPDKKKGIESNLKSLFCLYRLKRSLGSEEFPRTRSNLIAFATLIAASVTCFALVADARNAGRAARRGDAVRGTKLAGAVPLLGVRAEPAEVSPLHGSTRESLGLVAGVRCILYLGQSSGTAFFYVPPAKKRSGRTLRIPSSEVAITVFDKSTGC